MADCGANEHHSQTLFFLLLQLVGKRNTINMVESYNYVITLDNDSCENCIPCRNYILLKDLYLSYFDKTKTFDEISILMREMTNEVILGELNKSMHVEEEIPTNFKLVDKIDKKLIYLDQNILSNCIDDSEFKKSVISLKEKYQFVYSPSHIEEVHKLPTEDKKNIFLSLITEITDNILFRTSKERYLLGEEEPRYSLDRIILFDGSTQAVEDQKLAVSLDRSLFLKKYDSIDHKKKTGNEHEILLKISDNEFKELMAICNPKFKSRSEFANLVNPDKLVSATRALYDALDLLSYKVDKGFKNIWSGVHDIEHLIYASHCDHFVTNDVNLRLRAKQIYSVLKKHTNVIESIDLKKI